MKKKFLRFLLVGGIGLLVCMSTLPAEGLAPAGVVVTPNIFNDDFDDPDHFDANCSLREAIYTVIGNSDYGGCAHSGTWGYDTINLSAGIYNLTLLAFEDAGIGGDLDLYYSGLGAPPRSIQAGTPADITIQGSPELFSIIDANGFDHVFDIQAGVSVKLDRLRIQGGWTYIAEPSGGGIYNDGNLTLGYVSIQQNTTGVGGNGAGIYNHGTLTIEGPLAVALNMTVDSEDATDVGVGAGIYNDGTIVANNLSLYDNWTGTSSGTGEGGEGGGIYNAAGGQLTINYSGIVGNSCGSRVANHGANGGGIYNAGTMTINTSTISTNLAGGGISGTGNYYGGSGGGIVNASTGSLTITDSTIAQNRSGDSSGAGVSAAGGLFNSGGTVTMGNTILADNYADYSWDCFADVISTGYNLFGSLSGCSISGDTTGNIIGQDPKLAPHPITSSSNILQPLLFGSPAIDAGPATCGYIDQRHLLRPKDGDGDGTATCDIGAYEAFKWNFFPLMIRP
jgi:hypothetical protein